MMAKVRPAGSMMELSESMKQVVEISDRTALIEYLQREYDFLNPTEENVKVKYHGRDDRIDWDTYLITIDGQATLFANDPF